jgi:hypothetical protein
MRSIDKANTVPIFKMSLKQEMMMKTLNLTVVVSSLVLLAAGAAQAEGILNGNNNNFMAKRPYQAVVEKSAQQKDGQWEGATLIDDQVQVDESAANQLKTLRVNMLSKRPY